MKLFGLLEKEILYKANIMVDSKISLASTCLYYVLSRVYVKVPVSKIITIAAD